MVGLIFLVLLLILGALVVSPILAIIALKRSREVASLKASLRALETEHPALLQRVSALERAAARRAAPEPVAEEAAPVGPTEPELAAPLVQGPEAEYLLSLVGL